MNSERNLGFGLIRDAALLYSLDNYSRPDNWHDVGYELLYDLVLSFSELVRESDRVQFIDTLWDVFSHSFSIPKGHHTMGLIPDDMLSALIKKAFGMPLDEGRQMQPPFDNYRGLRFMVVWDKGRLDLRVLERLEDEIDNVAKLSHVRVALVNLIIIPRSATTIVARLNEISKDTG